MDNLTSDPLQNRLVFKAFQTAPASTQMETDLLHMTHALAGHSKQPLAIAIRKVTEANRIATCPVYGFEEFEGKGLGGLIQLPGESQPRAVLAGTREFVEGAGLSIPETLEVAARRWKEEGAIVVFVGWDAYVRGLLQFSPADQKKVS